MVIEYKSKMANSIPHASYTHTSARTCTGGMRQTVYARINYKDGKIPVRNNISNLKEAVSLWLTQAVSYTHLDVYKRQG